MDPKDPDFKDLSFGNKLSLLTGDYLLSTSSDDLAGLRNHEVNDLISSCLRDLTEVQFIEPRDNQNRPLPAPPLKELRDITIPNQFEDEVFQISEVLGNAKAEWTLRHLLDGASLLAKSCQGTIILAEHPASFQKLGHLFGRNTALAWQACKDRKIFESNKNEIFSLVCAPVLFHIQYDPSFYKTLMMYAQNNNTNYSKIKKVIRSGPGLQKTTELQEEFSSNASKILEEFPESEAKIALMNIINSL